MIPSDLAAVMGVPEVQILLASLAGAILGQTINVSGTNLRRKSGMQNPKFEKILTLMKELHQKKGNDYATDTDPYSNFRFAAQFAGVTVDQVFAVLIGIKEGRLRELLSANKQPNNESIQDTRLDAATYAALRASYHEEV